MSSPEKTIRRPRRLVYRLPPMTQRQRLAYYGIPYSPETSADENDDENENEQKIVDESKEEKCEVARNPGPFKEDIQTVATFTSQIFADNQPGNTSKENCYQDESSFALHTIARSLLNAIILPGKTLVAFDEEDEEEKTSETANIKATFNQSPYKSDEIEATNCSEDKSHENSSSNHDMEVDQSLTPQAKADSAIPKKDEENKSSKQEVGEKQNDEPKEDKKIWPWLIKRDAKIQRIAEEKEKRGNPTMDDVLPDSESTKTSKGQTNTIFHSQPSRLALLFQRFPPVPSSRTTNQNIFSLLPDTSHQPRERILLTTKKTKGLYGKVLDQSPPTLDVSQFKNFQRGNSDDTANLQERQNFEKKRAHPLTPQRQQIEFTDDRNNESLVASRVPPKRLPPNAPPSENVLEEFKEYQRIEKSRPFCSSGGKRNHPSSAQQPKPTSKLDHSNKEYLYRTKALDLLQQYQSPVTPRVAEPSQFNKLQHVETSRLHNPASSNDPESQIHQDFGKFTSADEEEFSGSHSDESVKTISPSTPPSENVMEDVVLQTPSPPKETSSPQEDIPESLIDHDFGNDSFGDNESSRRFIRLNEVSPVTTAHELAHTPGNDDSKPSTPAASRSSPQKPISPVQQAQRPTRQRKKPVKFNDYIL